MPLPTYSEPMLSVVMDPSRSLVEETVYHVLLHGNMTARSDYNMFCHCIYEHYPTTGFSGSEPSVWDSFCFCLSVDVVDNCRHCRMQA